MQTMAITHIYAREQLERRNRHSKFLAYINEARARNHYSRLKSIKDFEDERGYDVTEDEINESLRLWSLPNFSQ